MKICATGPEINTERSLIECFPFFRMGDPLRAEPPMETELTALTKDTIGIGVPAKMDTLTLIENQHYGVVRVRECREAIAANSTKKKFNQDALIEDGMDPMEIEEMLYCG